MAREKRISEFDDENSEFSDEYEYEDEDSEFSDEYEYEDDDGEFSEDDCEDYEDESEFSYGYESDDEDGAKLSELQALSNQTVRIKKYVIAFIPLFIAALMWMIIVIANSSATKARSQEKFDISIEELIINKDNRLEQKMAVKNNSKYDVSKMTVGLEFVDTSNNKKLGTVELETNGRVDAGEKTVYHTVFSKNAFTYDNYYYILNSDLDDIKVKVELWEVNFSDGKIINYSNYSWFWDSILYIFLLILTICYSAMWLFYIFKYTYCKKCKTVLAFKKVEDKIVGSNKASWNKVKEYKNYYGEKEVKIVRASGEELAHRIKYRCGCCGNVMYRTRTERIEK